MGSCVPSKSTETSAPAPRPVVQTTKNNNETQMEKKEEKKVENIEPIKEEDKEFVDYDMIRMVGKGAYAHVWEATHKPSGTVVAIKHQFDVFEDITTAKRILREICILRELDHPSIVKLYDLFVPGSSPTTYDLIEKYGISSICLAFELAVTSMDKLLKSSLVLEPEQVQLIMYNLLTGLHYVHSAGVLHRDLKPGNILLYNDCSVRICDFGLARTVPVAARRNSIFLNGMSMQNTGSMFDDPSSGGRPVKITKLSQANKKMTMHVATRWYRAPEIILQQDSYGVGVDVWAVGCIFAELLSIMRGSIVRSGDRKPLFPGRSCIGMSPTFGTEKKEETQFDQLTVILQVLGSPTEEDISLIRDKEIADYVRKLPKFKRVDFRSKYPSASDDTLELLEGLLVFNPADRITLSECLKHPYFASVRDPAFEVKAKKRLNLAVDAEEYPALEKLLSLYKAELEHYRSLRVEKKLYNIKTLNHIIH